MSTVTVAQAQTVACPNCYAKPNQHCTQPTEFGRTPVGWVHYAREAAYEKAQTVTLGED